jgi:hypothetical protein
MFPLCALMAIPAALTIRVVASWAGARRAVAAAAIAALVTFSAACTVLSVSVPFEQWYFVQTNNAGLPQTSQEAARREHDYYFSISRSHIAGDVRLIDEARPFPLRWFKPDRRIMGIVLLVFGGGVLMATAVISRRPDEPEVERSSVDDYVGAS